MQIICFEDSQVEQLTPVTLARPAYAISCASIKLIDWLRTLDGQLSVSVRPHLADLERLDAGLSAPDAITSNTVVRGGILLVNARLVPRVETLATLKRLAQSEQTSVILDTDGQTLLVARITESDCLKIPESGSTLATTLAMSGESGSETPTGDAAVGPLLALCRTLAANKVSHSDPSIAVFHWPHEIVAWHMREMPSAMQWRLDQGGYTETADGVFTQVGVKIGQYAAIDTSDGPILLDRDVSVGPFCYLSGPVYAGAGTRVIEHAALKDGVALGHTVKIGGEVEASVIEPYTNKQHHGFLGHSYLGSWINLGAGTCNSDLKNTYGKINIQYGDRKIATGMQFLGCIIGDYSKTAINTSIFTGKVIGVCSMLYGFATSNVPSYVNYARLFGQTAPLPAEVMVSTQQRMFSRRKVQQRPCDIQLIHDMYRLTESEREAAEQYGL
ncbi:putative sugar nucleotidyl transferase [Stieleria varia]|uniref:Bifunctional protein GlmU n=1 Tax=Stieleria varia TaxID=2528005 RepID=A0A5C6B3I4_9BACT|nr:putative sugar nucleotidyl transferase [Stieleria varia]TWU05836.1 Bifunctional protein GlmU [Stieleria varia]